MNKEQLEREFTKADSEQKQLLQVVSNATMKVQQLEGRKALLQELHKMAMAEVPVPAIEPVLDEKPA